MEEVCKLNGHAFCPRLPELPCGITAMPHGMFSNCQFLSFFKRRYWKGNFTVQELAQFLLAHKYDLFVRRDNGAIQFITSNKHSKANGVLLNFSGNIESGHWHSGEIYNYTGITIYQLTNMFLLLSKAMNKRLDSKNFFKYSKRVIQEIADYHNLYIREKSSFSKFKKYLWNEKFVKNRILELDENDEEACNLLVNEIFEFSSLRINYFNSLNQIFRIKIVVKVLKFISLLKKMKGKGRSADNKLERKTHSQIRIVSKVAKFIDIIKMKVSKRKLIASILLQMQEDTDTDEDSDLVANDKHNAHFQIMVVSKVFKFIDLLKTRISKKKLIASILAQMNEESDSDDSDDEGSAKQIKDDKEKEKILFQLRVVSKVWKFIDLLKMKASKRKLIASILSQMNDTESESDDNTENDSDDEESVKQIKDDKEKEKILFQLRVVSKVWKFIDLLKMKASKRKLITSILLQMNDTESESDDETEPDRTNESCNLQKADFQIRVFAKVARFLSLIKNRRDEKNSLNIEKKEEKKIRKSRAYSQIKAIVLVFKFINLLKEKVDKRKFAASMLLDINSSDEESENEEEEKDPVQFIWADEEDLSRTCCKTPIITSSNFNTAVLALKQFKNKKPEYECLFNLLKISNYYLEIAHQSSTLSSDAIEFIRSYVHFRHDVFNYIFVKEVLGYDLSFDSEEPIPESESNRTPDFYYTQGKTIYIYEFTVVANKLRANFLKGVDERTSKYRKEILILLEKGWDVKYFPIFFSTSEDVDSNIQNWKNYDVEVPNNSVNIFITYQSNLCLQYNYLFSLTFTDLISRDFPNFDKLTMKYSQVNDNWIFKIFLGNKQLFYNLKHIMQNYDFQDDQKYRIKLTKAARFYIQFAHDTENYDVYTGHKIKEILKDEGSFFTNFKRFFQGKEKIYLRTRFTKEKIKNRPLHGGIMIDSRVDTSPLIVNRRNQNLLTMEESATIDASLVSKHMSNINTVNNREDLVNALETYEKNLNSYFDPSNFKVKVQIDPRRSFLAFIDSAMITDIDYNLGIVLNSLNPKDITSNVAKSLISRGHLMKYHEPVESNNEEVEKLRQSYRSACNSFYYEMGPDQYLKYSRLLIEKPEKAEKLKTLKNQMVEAQIKYTSSIDKSKVTKGIRMTNEEKVSFKDETNWSSNRGYKLYNGELLDLNNLVDISLMATKPIKFRLEFPANEFEVDFLKKLKEISLKELKNDFNELSVTNIFNAFVFISRLAYTLMSISNQSFSGKFVKLDNLGLTDVVLLVKGGKKITSTRKTKIFKLIYPTFREIGDWNPTVFKSGSNYFDETPWMQLSQNQIFDLISSPYKMACNYTAVKEKHDQKSAFEMLSIPAMLLLHNRRKTEIKLHNMRYLCVNPLAEYSQVSKMIEEFSCPTYSAFDFSIIRGLKERYMLYFDSIREWSKHGTNDSVVFQKSNIQHPYQKRCINSIDDLTYVIYSTYMMSKGAYNQTLEQMSNLKSIMETHEIYLNSQKNHSVKLGDVQLLEDDFAFVPEVCYNVGKILASEIRNKNAVNNINIKWNQYLNNPVDSMANNRGLRYKGKDFFGHKGYYVVYKELMEKSMDEVIRILSLEDETKIYKELNKVNDTFLKSQYENPLNEVVMHVVDKAQRGGGREIYVMDYNTKLYQYPIEKMFKTLCELIDNEIISVPSARRAGLIHKKCFEYRSQKYKTYFFTFDCRKWAPRSNPEKYILMLLGMQEVIPEDFLKSVISYFSKHSHKKIHFRKEVVDKFLMNVENDKYKKYFYENENQQSKYFEMPYSFVMGIFNMLSSLLHAGGQIYAKNVIEKQYLENRENLSLDMFAHSDDSGGRLSIPISLDTETVSRKVLGNYEYIMKCMNHLMSAKKCSAGETYFELLSILYINHELLPLLPKFLGGVNIIFTGDGISSDFKQIISKSIELQTNGSTAAQAYKLQILLSNMYRNFYRVGTDTQLPALGGFVNSWPPLYMTYGSQVDEIRSCMYNPVLYKKIMSVAHQHLDYDLTDGTVNLKFQNVLRTPAAYKIFKNNIILPEFEDNQWFFEQNKTRHSALNLFWFRSKLSSSKFATAILNINEVKRAYDSLYMATGKHIVGKFKNWDINELLAQCLCTTPTDQTIEKVLRAMYTGFMRFYQFLEGVGNVRVSEKEDFTIKPTSIQLNDFIESPIAEYNPLHLSVSMCRPELLKYLYSNKRYGAEIIAMENYLKNLGVTIEMKSVKNFLDYMQKMSNTVVNFYSSVPSSERFNSSYNGIFKFIKNGFHKRFQIETSIKDYSAEMKFSFNISNKLKMCVLLYYLYIIQKQIKDDYFASVQISKSLYPEIGYISNAPTIIKKILPQNEAYTFIELLENDSKSSISLDQVTCWALWSEKQTKVGDDWLGYGVLHISLDGKIFSFKILNKEILSVKHKQKETSKFSDTAANFFYGLIKEFKLNFLRIITPEENKNYFGLDESGYLGLHGGNAAKNGIQNTEYDLNFDTTLYKNPLEHNYYAGNHYVNIANINNKLYTLDWLVFKESKYNLFDCIEWEQMNDATKHRIFSLLVDGKFGQLAEIEYDKQDLIDNMLSTELYRYFYNEKKKNSNLNKSMWSDILTNLNYSEDIFPTLYESLGLREIESILPISKKDNISLYIYYDFENEDLRTLRYKLKNIKDEQERINFLTNIMLSLKDNQGLVTLPEIGDPEEFKKFKKDNLPYHMWLQTFQIIIESCYQGYKFLTDKQRKDLAVLLGHGFSKYENFETFFYTSIIRKKNIYLTDYSALTLKQLALHEILSNIHENKYSFAEFSRSFRKTILKNLPRHPFYEEQWQSLLSEMYKYFACTPISEDDKKLFPGNIQRNNMFETLSFEDAEVYNEIKGKNTSIVPVDFAVQISVNNYDSKLFSLKSIIDNNLGQIDIDRSNLRSKQNGLIEMFEDEEIDIFFKSKKDSEKKFLFPSLDNLVSYANNDSVINRALITDLIIPYFNLVEVQVSNGKTNEKMFCYNHTRNNLIKPTTLNNKTKNLYNKHIKYYGKQEYIMPFMKEMIKKEINLDLDTRPTIDTLSQRFDVESQDSYNPQLVDYICEEFKLNAEHKIELTRICDSNKTAIQKFVRIRNSVNGFIKAEEKSEFNLDGIIKEIFKNNKGPISKMELERGEKIKMNLSRTERNPQVLIEKMTTNKKEFKQGNVIMNKKWASILVETLTLTSAQKKHLKMSFMLLRKNLKQNKLINEAATCSVALDIIENTKEGTTDTQSITFEEEMKILMNEMSAKLFESDDEEDVLDPPVERYMEYKFHFGT